MARPVIAFYDWCAHMALRAVGIEAKTELENTVSTVELSEMIAESLSEGLLDPEEHNRLSRALQIRTRVVADVAIPLNEVRAVPAAGDGAGPTVRAIQQALADSGYSRFPVTETEGRFIGYVHIKDVLSLVNDVDAVVDLSMVRALPKVADSLPLPDALSRLRRSNSHLALVTADRRQRDRDSGAGGSGRGPRRRHAASDARWLTGVLAEPDWTASERAHRRRVEEFLGPLLRRAQTGEAHPVWDFLFRYYSLRPASCASGIPASARCSADLRRAIHRGPVAGHRSSPGKAELLRLHEWAMVYRAPTVRHERVPLRLGAVATDAVVESMPLRCSHFDAFRFFTEPAALRNAGNPSRSDQSGWEQPGCLHANMDLRQGMEVAATMRATRLP